MTYLNGGYSIIKKGDANIFAKVNDALTNGKPILFYEDDNNCYYIDTMEKTGSDSIALTKGGKTIVITSSNVVTELGSIQNHLYSNNIYILGEDEETETCYIFVNILATKELTNTEIEDYIKQFLLTNRLSVSGYANSISLESISYDADTEKYHYINSVDVENTFEITSISNKTIQIF